MPHNIEAEQSVLGCLLIDNDASVSAFGRLTDADFYSPVHKTIFTAMKGIYEKSFPIDLVTLSSALTANGKIDSVGGIDYITTLSDIVPSSANLRHYIEILKTFGIKRKLISAANQIIEQSHTDSDDRTTLGHAEKIVFDIGREGERKDLTQIGGHMAAVMERLDTIQKDPAAVRGLQTGFWGLDKITNGLQKSDLIILAARPSVGKTSLALNIVLNAARKGKKCAIFSLEMSKEQLATRALCGIAGVSLTRALKGELNADEWSKIWRANKFLADAQIYVDDNSVITPAEITSKCMRLKREHGLDLVMIDYLGLMSGGSAKRESRQVEVADNSRYMKILAKELEVPVLLLSQLNRGIESRKGADARPVLSDLRESGAIEQDADIVMFIHRDTSEQTETPVEISEVELIVAKHRNGPTGSMKLRWIGECTSFANMTTDQAAQDARDAVASAKTKVKSDIKKETQAVQTEVETPKTTEKKQKPEKLPSTVPLDKSSAADVF